MTNEAPTEKKDQDALPRAILVVDDDAALRRMLRLTLADGGFAVRVAEDGRAALESIAGQMPDAVVLDLEMPVMDGREFYQELRNRGIEIPVIIVSAHGAKTARRELGADAALDKPFNPDALVSAVRELLP